MGDLRSNGGHARAGVSDLRTAQKPGRDRSGSRADGGNRKEYDSGDDEKTRHLVRGVQLGRDPDSRGQSGDELSATGMGQTGSRLLGQEDKGHSEQAHVSTGHGLTIGGYVGPGTMLRDPFGK